VSQACGFCGIAVPAPPCHTHATHVIYVTLTIKLGPARLFDVYTRVRAIVQVCGIARLEPQRHTVHICNKRDTLVTNVNWPHSTRLRLMLGYVTVRVRVRVVSQACGKAVPAPLRPTHATPVIYVTLTIKLGRPHFAIYTLG